MNTPALPNTSTLIRVTDFETTGLTKEDKVVEAAFCDVANDGGRWLRAGAWSSLVNPGMPIPPTAMAVHHITDEEVKDAPTFDAVKPHLGLIDAEEPVRVFAAHKADYEQQYYAPADASWICTWKVAITAWPDAPGHKNQELRYWLGLKLRPEMCARPHRAPDDAYVTAAILVRLLQYSGLTVQQMIEISSSPVVLPYLTFGMHAMKSFTARTMTAEGWAYDVPSGYLEWMLKQKDMDKNARHTAFYHLNLRRAG